MSMHSPLLTQPPIIKWLIQTSDAPSTIGMLLAVTSVISTKINLKVEDDPIAKEVHREAFAPLHSNGYVS